MPTTEPSTPCPAPAKAVGAHFPGVVMVCREPFTGGTGPQSQG